MNFLRLFPKNDKIKWIRNSFLFLWILIISLVLYLSWQNHQQSQLDIELGRITKGFQKDLSFRKFISEHGGVYVKIDSLTPENPYLDVPKKNIVSNYGDSLTLMNPAYVMRKYYKLGADNFEFNRIFSDKPLRPGNKSLAWESKLLAEANQLEKELHWEYAFPNDSTRVIRAVYPLYASEGCLKCHGKQGFQLGQLRGGLSIVVNDSGIRKSVINDWYNTLGGFLFLGLLGLLGIFLAFRFIEKIIYEKITLEKSLAKERNLGMIGRMFAGIAHDFKNHLGIIQLGHEALVEGNSGLKDSDELKVIKGGISQGQQLCKRIMNLGNPEKNINTKANLKYLIEESIAFCKMGPGKNIYWNVEFSSLPDRCQFSISKFQNALINIIQNAIQELIRSKIEKPEITLISLQNEINDSDIEKHDWIVKPNPGSFLIVNIGDNGNGIAPEILENLFKSYQTTQSQNGGTGLGLYSVQQFVKEIHGGLRIHTSTMGTQFFLYFGKCERNPK